MKYFKLTDAITMARRLRVAAGGGLQILRIAANMPNKQSRATD